MTTYRITARTDSRGEIVKEVIANNEDKAWRYFTNQNPDAYNGKVEELPTRTELKTRIAKLEEAIMAIHIDKEPYANVKSAILDAQKLVTK